MAIFNNYVTNCQRVRLTNDPEANVTEILVPKEYMRRSAQIGNPPNSYTDMGVT